MTDQDRPKEADWKLAAEKTTLAIEGRLAEIVADCCAGLVASDLNFLGDIELTRLWNRRLHALRALSRLLEGADPRGHFSEDALIALFDGETPGPVTFPSPREPDA